MRFGATRRGFESRPLRHTRPAPATPRRALAPAVLAHAPWGALAAVLDRRLRLDARSPGCGTVAELDGQAPVTTVRRSRSWRSRWGSSGSRRTSRMRARSGSSSPMSSAIRPGLVLFDTGFGFGNAELDAYYQIKARRVADALDDAGFAIGDIDTVVNCHLHVDHAGQNDRFPGCPDLRPGRRVGGRPHDRSHDPRVDRLPGRRLPPHRRRPRPRAPASGSWPRRVTRPATSRWSSRPAPASSSSPARRSTRPGSGSRDASAREGRSRAPDPDAYDRSVARLRAADPGRGPVRPRRGHLAAVNRRCGRPCYPSRAVLGGELAVPCSLQSAPAGPNPLSRSPFSDAARRCDVEDRVPRSDEPRTVSGPEGSSTKRSSSGAAERPGPSRSSRWARERAGRRRVHGISDPLRARPEEVVTSTVPHQALYRRWRAQTFSQIVGQEAVVETLRNAVRTRAGLARDPVRRATRHRQDLARPDPRQGGQLHGPPGRRSVRRVRRLRRDPRGHHARRPRDRRRVEPRDQRGPRACASGWPYPPGHLRRKVYILDEAHQITKDAWNALLKSLEEPPDFVIFMFASTEPSGFPPAILSRLQRYDVRRLTIPEIEGKLSRILDGRRPAASSRPPST